MVETLKNFINGKWDGPFTVSTTLQDDTLALALFINKASAGQGFLIEAWTGLRRMRRADRATGRSRPYKEAELPRRDKSG